MSVSISKLMLSCIVAQQGIPVSPLVDGKEDCALLSWTVGGSSLETVNGF